MAKPRNSILDYLLGVLAGFTSTWAISGLTCVVLLSHRLDAQHGPMTALCDLTTIYIHNGRYSLLCWVLLFSLVIGLNLLLSFLSRPIRNYRYFIAGLAGATSSVLSFIVFCNSSSYDLMPYFGSKGSLNWIAIQHHISPYWAMKDQVEFLSLAFRLVEHLDVLFSLFALPLLIVVISDIGRRRKNVTGSPAVRSNSDATVSETDKVPTKFPTRAVALAFAILFLPAVSLTAAGGIAPPEPEPPLFTVKVFVVERNISVGQIITAIDVRASTVGPRLDPDPGDFVQTNPVGKKAKFDLEKGQIVCSGDVQ